MLKDERIQLRVNIDEKVLLEKLAKDANMTISDYIKYRVFMNNPHRNEEKELFETPSTDKHNYYMMLRASQAVGLLFNYICEQKEAEKFTEFNTRCQQEVIKKMADIGYQKIELQDE